MIEDVLREAIRQGAVSQIRKLGIESNDPAEILAALDEMGLMFVYHRSNYQKVIVCQVSIINKDGIERWNRLMKKY